MEEFNKALPNKQYVDAANQLEQVRATSIVSIHTINLFLKAQQTNHISASAQHYHITTNDNDLAIVITIQSHF